MVRILHHKEKVPLRLPLSWWGGFAYLKGQRLCLPKVVWAGISSCTLKMAHFLENINWNRRVAMSLYTRVYNAVSKAEKHVTYVELIGTIVCLML
jgi:hypothetical protein